MNQTSTPCAALLAGCLLVGACRASSQTPPWQDQSAAQEPSAALTAADSIVRDGLISIDVVVTNAAANPVLDLAPSDLTLLDNGQPAKIRTLHNSLAPSEPPPELIFVLDTVNLSYPQLTQTESGIVRFLRQNGGRLQLPCMLYRFQREGLFWYWGATRDGNRLAEEAENNNSPRAVWTSSRKSNLVLHGSWENSSQPNSLSLRALGSIAIDQREIAGRKILVWIGPGWPPHGDGISFDEATELSTRLREARITLDNIRLQPDSLLSFLDPDSPLPPQSQNDMQPATMAPQAIAARTGGLVLDSSSDLSQDIARCIEQERSFYTLTFNPPRTDTADEYHDLHLQFARPGLTARAPNGYYNEPVYFDHPQPGIQKVTVSQLEDLVHAQTDLLRKLENIELTERLSTPRLDALLAAVHGEKQRQALTAAADLSIALPPSAGDILDRPPPPIEEQRAILRRTFIYLQDAIPKLPDFYALRNLVGFEEPNAPAGQSWKMPHRDQTLHFATSEHATVLYRNGKEVVEQNQKLGKYRAAGMRSARLTTRGTFGPILAYVFAGAARPGSSIKWSRWERAKDGYLAVFSYVVSATNFLYQLEYCCLPQHNGTALYQSNTGTSGEFAINPDTGAIMRIVINADLDEERDPDVPLIRSQLMVEYGPEQLGGKTYICPRRSVNISRGRSVRELHEWGMAFSVYGYFETIINDLTFGGYHKFGSEARILPGFKETDQTNTPAIPKKER